MKDLNRKKRFTMRCLLAGLMVLAVTPDLAFAQSGTGIIRGTVRDAKEAVVPGAEVTLTNTETNVSRKSQTSEVGIYYFGAIPRGPYTLVVELAGFKKWSSKLELQVGQTAALDAVLELGSIETTLEVVGTAPDITTESMEVSDVKDFQRIRQLPLNGRAISNLFDLTPGVEGGGNARVNGLKVGSLEITLDGMSLVDRFGGGIARIQPGLDTHPGIPHRDRWLRCSLLSSGECDPGDPEWNQCFPWKCF